MLKFFPVSATAKKSLTHFIVVLAAYVLLIWAVGLVKDITGWAPLVGKIISICADIFRLYCVVGIVVTILYYFGFIKK